MIYEVQFCKAWVGTWKFDANDDYWAYKKAQEMINEHTQVVTVGIDSIYELDENNKQIRKLPEYEECKRKSIRVEKEKREKREEAIYIAYFIDDTRSEPFIAKNSPKDIIAKEIAEQRFTKKIRVIEKLLFEEKAIYKAYFSDGECSGPYITEINENDTNAKEMAKYKLKQHVEYNGLDVNKLKVVKIEELNEDNTFIVNRDFVERNNRRIKKLEERKNRFIENAEV
jgi:hypothetical protein